MTWGCCRSAQPVREGASDAEQGGLKRIRFFVGIDLQLGRAAGDPHVVAPQMGDQLSRVAEAVDRLAGRPELIDHMGDNPVLTHVHGPDLVCGG